MRKAVLTGIAVVFLIPLLSSCDTGARELDARSYVYTIGVDRGVSDLLRFTFQFPALSGQSGKEGGSGSPKAKTGSDLSVITIDCATIYGGIELIYSSYSRRLDLTHAKFLIISEELARESVEPFINGMTRSSEIRRSMYVIVAKGTAMGFINEFKPFAGTSVAKSQEMFMENSEQSALYESVFYNSFANRLKCTKCQATATLAALNDFSNFKESGSRTEEFISEGDYYPGEMPRRSENKFEFLGTAIFSGGKMVGELSGNETRSMLLLRGTYKESQMVVPDPEDSSLRVGALVFQKHKPKIKITFEEGRPKIHAAVFLEGSLQNVQNTGIDDETRRTQLEEAFEEFIKEKLDQTVKKCQELNCEVFDFGYKAARQFWTIQDWEKFDWLSIFKNVEVTTEVQLIMRRTGTIIFTEADKKAEE